MRKIAYLLMLLLLSPAALANAAGDYSPQEIYRNLSPAVVLIISRDKGRQGRAGAGSIIREDGCVLTNAHVVFNKDKNTLFKNIFVYLKPEKVTGSMRKDLVNRFMAKVLAYDTRLDLALLKISDLPKRLRPIRLADSSRTEIGEEVLAIGHPEQGGLWTLSVGRVSGQIDDYSGINGKDVFQTDTSINRGNSGGPLLNAGGLLVAVNSNIARIGKGGVPITGVNFAIKSSVVKEWLDNQGRPIPYGKIKAVETTQPTKPRAGLKARPQEPEKETKPVLKLKPPREKVTPKPKETKQPKVVKKTERPALKPDERILTPRNPYDMDDLIRSAEEDLENLMEEMRMKFKRRRQR